MNNNDNIREIGGNMVILWFGRVLRSISEYIDNLSIKYTDRGKKTIISNPSCKFINHCTIILNFTINNIDKYQLILEGEFREKYKEWNKRVDEYNIKMKEYDRLLYEWENSDKNSRGSAPIKPHMEEYPLKMDEMFHLIISNQNKWYKK